MNFPLIDINGLVKANSGGPVFCEDSQEVPVRWKNLCRALRDSSIDKERIVSTLGDRSHGFYFIEELMGFIGGEKAVAARKSGLRLLEERFRKEAARLEKRYPIRLDYKGKAVSSLAASYRYYYQEKKRSMLNYLRLSAADPGLLSEPDGSLYLGVVRECLNAIGNLGDDLVRLRVRLQEVSKTTTRKTAGPGTDAIDMERLDNRFFTPNLRQHDGFALLEVVDERSSDFWEAYCLLACDFGTDVMYSPRVIREVTHECRVGKGSINTVHAGGTDRLIWSWWITAVIKDPNGRIVCAGDGSLISDGSRSIFYASHIAVKPNYRSHNLGTFMSAGILQIAENKLKRYLPASMATEGSQARRLSAELGEIEFPDHFILDPDSHKRLVFHGRLGRRVLWPAFYAQPDTDYRSNEFIPEKWNSVPMFICHRSFREVADPVDSVRQAVNLLFDFYSVLSSGGAEHDRTYMLSTTDSLEEPQLVNLPVNEDELAEFLDRIGMRREILEQHYPGHFYTQTRV